MTEAQKRVIAQMRENGVTSIVFLQKKLNITFKEASEISKILNVAKHDLQKKLINRGEA